MAAGGIRMERDENIYLITMGAKKIVTTWARTESEIKQWLSEVQKFYGKKQNKNPLIVGLSAERSTNYANGLHSWDREKYYKNKQYELLQLCVGNHCLLWEMDSVIKNSYVDKVITIFEQPKLLKDFLYNSRTTIVGVGINALVGKLEKDTDFLIPNKVELRDLAEKKIGATKDEFRKHKVESLAKVVLGEEVMEVVKPTKLSWVYNHEWIRCGNRGRKRLTDDLVKYASLEVFLAAQMGSKLLNKQ